jgi:hypothetical protein
MRRWRWALTLALALGLLAGGPPAVPQILTQPSPGLWDFSTRTLRVPHSTTLPATCSVGDVYMDTDATSGLRWYLCESSNTWVAQGGTTVSGATPSASVGLSAVNGSAGTFLRSDGAPALDQSIAPTWTGVHQFSDGKLQLKGATSGTLTLKAAATAGTNTLTLPAGTTDLSSTGGTSQVVKQTSSGGALTVARLACADLSDAGSGCTGTSSSGGTVTSVATGFGLTGGTITGSGTVSMVAPSSDDQVYVSDSSSAATWRTLPNCTDAGGQHLNYTQSTNTFSCGTTSTLTTSGFSVSGQGPLLTLTNPTTQSFAWVNQGTAAASTTSDALVLSDATHSGDNVRVYKKTAPSTPYTITVGFFKGQGSVDFVSEGLTFRESSSGKLATCTILESTGTKVGVSKYTNPTTFSANYTTMGWTPGTLAWLRISDDGTNRKCLVSNDGTNWTQIHSVGRTDFLTADEVGLLMNFNFGVSATFYMTVLSWQQQ